MKLAAFLKLLLVCASISFLSWLMVTNYQTDKLVKELDPSGIKLKNDPLLDSSVNRIRYAEKKQEIEQRYDKMWELKKKRHYSLFSYLAVFVSLFTGWVIRRFWKEIFIKRNS